MIWVGAHRVEECFTHVVAGTVEHQRARAVLNNQVIDTAGVTGCGDVVAQVTQRKRQQLGNLRRVVNQQDAWQVFRYFLLAPLPGSRFFLPSEGSRSIIQIRPPAV